MVSLILSGVLLLGMIPSTQAQEVEKAKEYRNVGYVFQRGSDIAKLDVSKITHLNYSFGLIYNKEFKAVKNAETGEVFGPEMNFDVATPTYFSESKLHTIYLPPKVDADLKRIDELKEKNPNLKVLLSVGGYDARGFSDAAATEEARKVFAKSCKDTIDKYGLDGIDLDWEYPVNGAWGSIKAREEDKHHFTLMLQEVRNAIGEDKLLTIAGSANTLFTGTEAGGNDGTWTEFEKVMPILDFINIMTYDFQYDSNYFGSAIYPSKQWPAKDDFEGYWVDKAVQNYLAHGCPPEKINLGLAFAAPTPQVVRGSEHYPVIRERLEKAGFYTSSEPGLKRVKDLLENKNGFTKEWDEDAKVAYIATEIDGEKQFVMSYIEPQGLTEKINYVKENNLGGTMFWEFGSDYDNSLVTQIAEELFITTK